MLRELGEVRVGKGRADRDRDRDGDEDGRSDGRLICGF